MSSSKVGRTESINCKSALADRKLVPDEQIELFCDILRFKGDRGEGFHDESSRNTYRNRIRPLVAKLNFPLAKPGKAAQLLLPKQSKYTHLCDMHDGLNADFVHQWFKFLALEVGARLEILRSSSREHVGPYAWDNVVKPLTRLHKIWLTLDEVEVAFDGFIYNGFENTIGMIDAVRQPDGCEACILARIGTHINTLWAIRCLVKSRLTIEQQEKHPTRLRLLRIIEPWIKLFQARYGVHEEQSQKLTQIKWNTGLAEELYEKRKEVELDQHRKRRAQRHNLELHHSNSEKYKQYVKALEATAIEDSLHDAENDIIDTYAALRATQRSSALLNAPLKNPQDVAGFYIGPTHREGELVNGKPYHYDRDCDTPVLHGKHKSTISIPISGKSSPYNADVDPTYLESRYSVDTVRNNDRAAYAQSATLGKLQPGAWLDPKLFASGSRMRNDSLTSRTSQTTVWPVQQNGSRVELLGQRGEVKPKKSSPLARQLSERAPSATARSDRSRKADKHQSGVGLARAKTTAGDQRKQHS